MKREQERIWEFSIGGGGRGGVSKPHRTKLRAEGSDHQRVPPKTGHCVLCLEFRLATEYNGSPYANQLNKNRRSWPWENFSVKQISSAREGGPPSGSDTEEYE